MAPHDIPDSNWNEPKPTPRGSPGKLFDAKLIWESLGVADTAIPTFPKPVDISTKDGLLSASVKLTESREGGDIFVVDKLSRKEGATANMSDLFAKYLAVKGEATSVKYLIIPNIAQDGTQDVIDKLISPPAWAETTFQKLEEIIAELKKNNKDFKATLVSTLKFFTADHGYTVDKLAVGKSSYRFLAVKIHK